MHLLLFVRLSHRMMLSGITKHNIAERLRSLLLVCICLLANVAKIKGNVAAAGGANKFLLWCCFLPKMLEEKKYLMKTETERKSHKPLFILYVF
jgi:hypothetical protein